MTHPKMFHRPAMSGIEIIILMVIVGCVFMVGLTLIADFATCTRWETQMVEQMDCVEIVEGVTSCTTSTVPEPVCVSRE